MENVFDEFDEVLMKDILAICGDTDGSNYPGNLSSTASTDILSPHNAANAEEGSEPSAYPIMRLLASFSGSRQAQQDTKTLSSFTLFPKLPFEVRLMIWGFACHHTRNVDIWAKSIPDIYLRECATFRYVSSCPPPAILGSSKEGRTEGLKHYELAFGSTFNLAFDIKITVPPRIYFNFQADRACPLGQYERGAFDDFCLRGLSRIAINTKEISVSLTFLDGQILDLNPFTRGSLEWIDNEYDEVLIYESMEEPKFPLTVEFEDTGLDRTAGGEGSKLEGFKSQLNSRRDWMIKKERQASVKKVEEEHEKAGIEFPQSLREEMEGAATNRPFIKIMKLKEASPEIPV